MNALTEARFTAATDRCQHPEWWTSQDDDSTENEVADLVYGLVRGLQPDYCVETGTAYGVVARRITDALRMNRHGHLDTIEFDPERVRSARDYLSNEIVGGFVSVIQADAVEWTPERLIDFAWIDSSYNYFARIDEFDRYRPKMRPGTVVGFHDTAPLHGGSQIAGADYMSVLASRLRGKARLIHLPTPRGVTLAEVLP